MEVQLSAQRWWQHWWGKLWAAFTFPKVLQVSVDLWKTYTTLFSDVTKVRQASFTCAMFTLQVNENIQEGLCSSHPKPIHNWIASQMVQYIQMRFAIQTVWSDSAAHPGLIHSQEGALDSPVRHSFD